MAASKGVDLSTCPQARVVKALWTPAEQQFASILTKALRSKVNVFLKVRVLDVIDLIDEPDQHRLFFWRNYLGNACFDFVICSKQSLVPLLAVELDDDMPLRRGRATQDVAKNTVSTRAQFPLIRISASVSHTPETLRKKLIEDFLRVKAGALPSEMS